LKWTSFGVMRTIGPLENINQSWILERCMDVSVNLSETTPTIVLV
jgi:hypothetical protein